MHKYIAVVTAGATGAWGILSGIPFFQILGVALIIGAIFICAEEE